jgi:peptide/nickel transport system substrate-binding protein
MSLDADRQQPDAGDGVTRRRLLQTTGAGALAVGGASLLAACGTLAKSSSKTTGTTSASVAGLPNTSGGGVPRRGGTLTVGGITGGSSETLNPPLAVTDTDAIRAFQLFDRLFLPSGDLQTLVPQLALSAESNKDASVWTFELRPGVTWHDGKPFTADDVVYSITRFWTNPDGQAVGQTAAIDLKGVRKRGPLVVEVPLLQPQQDWPAIPTTNLNAIVQNGATAKSFSTRPIGTGPFKFVSFSPGRQSVFTANRDYWESGKPYIDELIFNTSFAEDETRLNALLSGEIDLMPQATFTLAKEQQAGGQSTVFGSKCPQPYMILMRVDKGPLSDVRVRQAMRLIADRPALIEGALSGYGSVGYDLLGQGTRYYDSSLTRGQDIEQAKSLLKSAGMAGATFTLQTSNVAPGYVESATLFAQQAKAAGITINVQQESPSTYYTPAGGFLSGAFRQDNYLPLATLSAYYSEYMSASSSLNETFWTKQPNGAAAEALLNQAIAATDPSTAQELWNQVQMLQFNQGGLLLWACPYFVNIAGPRAKGVTESQCGFLNNGDFRNAWVTSA